MSDITKLGVITAGGVTFQKGDNGPQIFYDYEADGLYWVALQPKLVPNSLFKVPWWAAHVWRGRSICNLNLCFRHLNGSAIKDPLYDVTDSGYDDPPIKLLTAMAELISNGTDPWTLPKVIEEAQP